MKRPADTQTGFDGVKLRVNRQPVPDTALRALETPQFRTRFYDKVTEADNGCHVWTACVNSSGYGMISIGGYHAIPVHRAAWIIHSGQSIPPGYEVDHLCRNKLCVNPQHLDVVTHSVNMQRLAPMPSLEPMNPPTLRVRHYPTRVDPVYQVLWRQIVDGRVKQCGRTFPSRRMADEFMAELSRLT